MNLLIIFFGTIVIVFLFLVLTKRKVQLGFISEKWPFYAKRPLSKPEQIFYFRLIEALPENVILAQVQLSRFLGIRKGNNNRSWLNRINRMSADYIVCGKDFSILAVIELDDSSHDREDRKISDAKKSRAITSADIKLVRWNVKDIPDVSAIRLKSQEWRKTDVAQEVGFNFVG